VSELQVELNRYTHLRCRLLNRWNRHLEGEEKDRDAVHERMEVGQYHAPLQTHHLEVVELKCIVSFLGGCDGGE